MLVALGMVSLFYGFMTAVAQEIPRLDPDRLEQRSNGIIYAGDGKTVLAILRSRENRIPVPSDRISDAMRQAIIAIEDRRFFAHGAVDPIGLTRAAFVNITGGSTTQGGSTITQQFIKNAYTGPTRSIRRKIREAALAYQLEHLWSKDRILTAYLNTVYFGHGAYGVEAAAQVYFGSHARLLDPPQAALLAGLVRSPTAYDPVARPGAALERRDLVLDAMGSQGYLDDAALQVAKAAPLLEKGHAVELPAQSRGVAAYFTEHVKQQLVARYGKERAFGGGLRVYTTIDLRMQRAARKAVRKELRKAGPTGALVAIDPRNGAVKAMVGGENFAKLQFNLATQARRQPGSAFKPFVLLAALEQGILPQTHFTSRRQLIPIGSGLWFVTNEGGYLGSIPLTTATVASDNTVFAQLTMRVGPAAVREAAHDMGIVSPLDAVPAIGLGGVRYGVSPLEMAHAYATLSAGGVRTGGSLLFRNIAEGEADDASLDPISIIRVEDAEGRVIERNRPVRTQVVDRDNALQVISMLKPVLRIGTARRIATFDRPAAGKTGTTSNFVDAWFAGITPQLATAVWVGYPRTSREMRKEFGGDEVYGGTFPAMIWRGFMDAALWGVEKQDWDAPELPGGEAVLVDIANGKRTTSECPRARELVLTYEKIPAQWSTCAGAGRTVLTPDLSGYSTRKAEDTIDRAGLRPLIVERVSYEGDAPGTVIAQTPGPSEPARVGQKVTIWVAKDVLWVTMPEVVGRVQRTAISELRTAGFRVRVQPSPVPGRAGVVTMQVPSPGDQPRGVRVTVWIGKGTPGAIAAEG